MAMQDVFLTFHQKLPQSVEQLLPGERKAITFWNPYSIYKSKGYEELFASFSYIGSDGILPLIFQSIHGVKNTHRYSFDMTSVAPIVFEYAVEHRLSVYFIGAHEDQIEKFMQELKNRYPDLKIAGWHHGYVKEKEKEIQEEILRIAPDVVIIGMGTPLQEMFSISLRKAGFKGTTYTCGGFIHQSAQKFEYFNRWCNKLHLRALYRIIREPYVWRRVLFYYPRFVFSYNWFLIRYRKLVKKNRGLQSS